MYAEIIDELAAQGRCSFSFAERVERLDASPLVIRSALNRLKKKGLLALPYQEFYVICQSTLNIDPPSASKIDPPQWLVFL